MQHVLRLLDKTEQGLGKRVERRLVLRLRRLDHQRLGHNQREVDGRCVESPVQQALGYVHGRDPPPALQFRRTGDEFVHAAIAVGHREKVLHAREQVVGVEYGVFRHSAKTLRAVGQNIADHSHQHARVAEEAPYAANRFGPVEVEPIALVPRTTTGEGR